MDKISKKKLDVFKKSWHKNCTPRSMKPEKNGHCIMEEQIKEENVKVLIVDDERDMCWVLSRVFEDAGYKVITAVDGKETLTKVEKEEPELVILDVKLPDMGGMEVLSTIKKVKPEIGVIMISAYGTEEIRKKAMRIGAYDFIDKPFSVERILRTVKEALLDKVHSVRVILS